RINSHIFPGVYPFNGIYRKEQKGSHNSKKHSPNSEHQQTYKTGKCVKKIINYNPSKRSDGFKEQEYTRKIKSYFKPVKYKGFEPETCPQLQHKMQEYKNQ